MTVIYVVCNKRGVVCRHDCGPREYYPLKADSRQVTEVEIIH